MAKLLTPTEPIPVSAFHVSPTSLQDVFELAVFSAERGYIWQCRCVQEVDGAAPTFTVTLTPKGVEARKTTPPIVVNNTEWVLWDSGTFTVKSDLDITSMYQIEDADPPSGS